MSKRNPCKVITLIPVRLYMPSRIPHLFTCFKKAMYSRLALQLEKLLMAINDFPPHLHNKNI